MVSLILKKVEIEGQLEGFQLFIHQVPESTFWERDRERSAKKVRKSRERIKFYLEEIINFYWGFAVYIEREAK